MRDFLLSWTIASVYRLLAFTWRMQIIDGEDLSRLLTEKKPVVYAHWHGDEMALLPLMKPYGGAAMVSTSKDGNLMAAVLARFGVPTARGSSTRGGSIALRGILRLSEEGFHPTVAVDGPKGPIYKAKPGVVYIARALNSPIYPAAAVASRAWRFPRSWNQTYLPKPFARVVIVWGQPVTASEQGPDSDLETATEVEISLNDARRRAGDHLATLGVSR